MRSEFEQVHNYYERLVIERVVLLAERHATFNQDMLADVCCVALNRLPPRYIRHDVDLVFYMPEAERQAIYAALEQAVDAAFEQVAQRRDAAGS